MFQESLILRDPWKESEARRYFANDPKYSWFHEHFKNGIYNLNLHVIKYKAKEILCNLRNKTVVYVICIRTNA